MPTLITNSGNNFGLYQFPEKLIPLMVVNALAGNALPVYGDGRQVRDWLYVEDHCSAIRAVLSRGRVGGTYNVGGRSEQSNISVVLAICALMDELAPSPAGSYRRLVSFVTDRPGHDCRYAVDSGRIEQDLGWKPVESFAKGLRKTVQWYLDNATWLANVQSSGYSEWVTLNYGHKAVI